MRRLYIDITFKNKQGNMLIEMTDEAEWNTVTNDLCDAAENDDPVTFNFGDDETIHVHGSEIMTVRSYRGK